METYRPFVVTNLSAQNLENVRMILRMKVYAVASITGGPPTRSSKFTTYVDEEGETNPKWTNTRVNFTLHDPSLQSNRLYLNISFYCSRTIRGDKYVGRVSVPIKPLFDMIVSGNVTDSKAVQYPVVGSSGREQGLVHFSFKFGEPKLGYQSNVGGGGGGDQEEGEEDDQEEEVGDQEEGEEEDQANGAGEDEEEEVGDQEEGEEDDQANAAGEEEEVEVGDQEKGDAEDQANAAGGRSGQRRGRGGGRSGQRRGRGRERGGGRRGGR